MGSKGPLTGEIGICAQCRNKAEIRVYEGWNPEPVCEDCQRDNVNLEKKSQANGGASLLPPLKSSPASSVPVDFRGQTSTEERDRYIAVIAQADPKWVDRFIKEVMAKNVLLYDWKEIIKFDRWFSVLDLRRFALEVNPNFESEIEEELPPSTTSNPKKTRRKRQPQSQATVGA